MWVPRWLSEGICPRCHWCCFRRPGADASLNTRMLQMTRYAQAIRAISHSKGGNLSNKISKFSNTCVFYAFGTMGGAKIA